ncbi:MAG: LAGLIDADG family homing endonuclease [Patescibacteria group bacterium]
MPHPWTTVEKGSFHRDLHSLYVNKNLSIKEIGKILLLAESTVWNRLVRLGISSRRHLKLNCNNSSRKITIPSTYTPKLAEFFGVMFGDGHVGSTQVTVTLGTKELRYVQHVALLMGDIFKTKPSIFLKHNRISDSKYRMVYFGSVEAVRWLLDEGLVHNKVKSQVGVPQWIFSKREFMKAFLRGFFDTDGSVYRLRFGVQISFTNRSMPILTALQRMLKKLEYNPSKVSGFHLYLTRRRDIDRFFCEVRPNNPKHQVRFLKFRKCVGTQVVNGGRL